jgi:hypothetical protein
MKKLFKYVLPAIIATIAFIGVAHGQVFSPNYFTKVGNNIYPIGNVGSTTIGSSTVNGAFNNLNISGTCTGAGCAGGISTTTANTFTAPQTFATTTNAINIEGTLYADQFPGADMGAKINNAYAALPSAGGTIVVSPGTYLYSTPIVFGTAGKTALLEGAAGGGFYSAGGTTLQYTSSTGIGFTYNVNNYSSAGIGLSDLSLVGPAGIGGIGSSTSASNTTSTVGVFLGGANGATGFNMNGVNLSGWGKGLQLGNNISLLNVTNSVIQKNGMDIYSPTASGAVGENNRVSNSILADSNAATSSASSISQFCVYVQMSGNVQWTFDNNSIDDCQLFSTQSGGTANIWRLTDNHFENPNTTQGPYDFVKGITGQVGSVVFVSTGNDYMNDFTSSPSTEDITNGATFISQGDTVEINNNAVPTTNFITDLDSNDVASWSGLTQKFANTGQTAAITNVVGTIPYSGSGLAYGVGTVENSFATSTAYISNQNTVLSIPSNYATVGCPWNTSDTDLGKCVNDAYNSASSTASSVVIMLPSISATYTTGINLGNNGERALLEGSPGGTQLTFNNTTTAAIQLNYGIQGTGILHEKGEGLQDFTLIGLVATTTQASNVGIRLGGSNGDAGSVINGVNVMGFDKNIENASNSYNIDIENSISRNGGYLFYADGTGEGVSNSGESINLISDFFVDGANNTASNTFYLATSSISSMFINGGGSIDDAQIFDGGGNLSLTLSGVHMENPGVASWGSYPYIVQTTNTASNLTVLGGAFLNDATTAGGNPPEFAQVTLAQFYGVTAYKIGSQTVSLFAARVPSSADQITTCNILNGNSAFTTENVNSGAPGQLGCYYNNTNSWTSDLPISAANGIAITNGGVNVGTVDASGNWVLGISGTGGSVKVQGNVSATGTIQSAGASSTILLGTSLSASHGCIEIYDAVNSSTLMYVYSSSSALVDTSISPGFCK